MEFRLQFFLYSYCIGSLGRTFHMTKCGPGTPCIGLSRGAVVLERPLVRPSAPPPDFPTLQEPLFGVDLWAALSDSPSQDPALPSAVSQPLNYKVLLQRGESSVCWFVRYLGGGKPFLEDPDFDFVFRLIMQSGRLSSPLKRSESPIP